MQRTTTGRIGAFMVVCLLACPSSVIFGATVAYWRFEEGPADAPVPRGGLPNGTYYAGTADSSGNGYALSAWGEGGFAGYAFRTDVPANPVPLTGAANGFSVQNTGDLPGMFTETGTGIQTMTPAAFTIEASFKPTSVGGYRAIIGRDSRGTATTDAALSALYLQTVPGEGIAIKFCDVSGYWHQAISAGGLIQANRWYHVAAVSDGSTLSLYLDNAIVAQSDLTLSGSPDTRLTAGAGDGGDWDAGNWSVGRGLHNGNHVDRFLGFIDEVRISDAALDPSEFLFRPEYMTLSPETVAAATVDAPVQYTLVIPSTCNATQAVDVTVTSSNPAAAKPVGSTGSTVVHFPAGGQSFATFNVEFGTPGQAQLTLSATGGCVAAPGAASTVTVNALESVTLVVPYDVMAVNQTQQAVVSADYGSVGTRNVSAASFGTTYSVNPAGVIQVTADGEITAVGQGTAAITAMFNGITAGQQLIAVMPADHTVAYWRFEEGPVNANVRRGGAANGVFYPGVADSSGNGNALSAWSDGGFAGYAYRTDRAATSVPEIRAANNFSVQNTGGSPGMFTQTGAPIQTISPAAWTIEVSIKPENGGYRTIVGRDSQGAATTNPALAALYLQLIPDNAIAIKFADVSGYWHEAVSAPHAVRSFAYPDVASGHWHHVAAVCDGKTLSLYVNDVDAETGYQLVAHSDLTLSGSPNTALTAGLGDGGDWDAGNWSVGRGLYNGGHGDRAWGFIDEVRISDVALDPSQFLFSPDYVVLWPNKIDAAPVDSPTVSLVIPGACNESQSINVTVTSDNPAVAKPTGTSGSTVVDFPAGNGRLKPLPIELGAAGQAHFGLSATGGCQSTPGAALTVTVHPAETIELQVTFDKMKVGQTQQAGVKATFGVAGSREVAAAAGTTYSVQPAGVVNVSATGQITAVGLGTATVTASYGGLTSSTVAIQVITPSDVRPKIAGSGILLVDLSAKDATAGQSVWLNKGSLGDFTAVGGPVLETVGGEQAVTFRGADAYQGPLAPVELRGGQGRTIEVWVFNPSLTGDAEGTRIENMVSWGHRGGPNGSLVTFNFGDHPDWGAVGHWGAGPDLGWNPGGAGSPPLGEWRHLVYTYDPNDAGGTTRLYDNGVQVNFEESGVLQTHPGYINLCVQNNTVNPMDLYMNEIGILSLAVVRIHDGVLAPADVIANYRMGISRGAIPPDLDLDGDVDDIDFEYFSDCAAGPAVGLAPDCDLADFDGDGDGDMDDFSVFQRCYSAGQPATPGCAD